MISNCDSHYYVLNLTVQTVCPHDYCVQLALEDAWNITWNVILFQMIESSNLNAKGFAFVGKTLMAVTVDPCVGPRGFFYVVRPL